MTERSTLLKIATTATICVVMSVLANFVRLPVGGAQAGFLIGAIAAAFCIARLRYRILVSTILAACGGGMASWLAALLLPVQTRWSPLDDGYDSFLQADFLVTGAVTGALTALICQFWWRRRRQQQAVTPFRFSTRQMTIAVTAFSILLAGATARTHQRQRAEELAKAWAPLGVSFTFDYWYRPKSAWTVMNNRFDDGALEKLTRLTTLQSLNLTASAVTDSGLSHVAKLPSLKQLMIGGLPITDAGLARLSASPSLRDVDLLLTRVTSDGVLKLCEQSNLSCVRVVPNLAETVNASHRPPPSVGETQIAFSY